MEEAIEAQDLWLKVEEEVSSERDRRVLKLILSGERSTEALAEALELTDLPPGERRRKVKQHRDRLVKILKRLGEGLGHDDDA
jgi:RNA polymerase sigma-70 factor (ECF subfamily)